MKDKTQWDRLLNMSDDEINKAASTDPDALPLSQKELKKFKRVQSPASVDVRAIREKMHASQVQFASFFGVSPRTIQEWEQHRKTPSGPARNFLRVIEKEPAAVQRALGSLN